MTFSTSKALKKEELWNVSLLPVELPRQPTSRLSDEVASEFDERSGVHRLGQVSLVSGGAHQVHVMTPRVARQSDRRQACG
ncbi:MAG TPA: hypothetical protein VHB79_29120 [Polyangiaceae bacterium]|nr:hypothetical protein [Polyangiaceae bacterium]